MSQASPIRAGLAAIHQNPVIALLEIAWRWIFGLISTILLCLGARAFIVGLKFSEGDEQALRGHDPMMIAAALLHILQQPGGMQSLCSVIAAVTLPSAIIWIAAATLGRTATLKKLLPGTPVSIKAILGFNIARTALLFAAVVGWVIWMILCSAMTISPGETFNFLYLVLALSALPVIAFLWGVSNWLFSFAPVVASRAEGTAWSVYTETLSVVRTRRRTFTSVTTWLGLPRLAAMIIALIFAILVLIATDSVLVGTVAIAIISLAYCAFADYLYIVRLAAYAQIARELPIATAATPL